MTTSMPRRFGKASGIVLPGLGSSQDLAYPQHRGQAVGSEDHSFTSEGVGSEED